MRGPGSTGVRGSGPGDFARERQAGVPPSGRSAVQGGEDETHQHVARSRGAGRCDIIGLRDHSGWGLAWERMAFARLRSRLSMVPIPWAESIVSRSLAPLRSRYPSKVGDGCASGIRINSKLDLRPAFGGGLAQMSGRRETGIEPLEAGRAESVGERCLGIIALAYRRWSLPLAGD